MWMFRGSPAQTPVTNAPSNTSPYPAVAHPSPSPSPSKSPAPAPAPTSSKAEPNNSQKVNESSSPQLATNGAAVANTATLTSSSLKPQNTSTSKTHAESSKANTFVENTQLANGSTISPPAVSKPDLQRIQERLKHLITIPSYIGQERKAIELVKSWLDSLKGVEVDYWNQSLRMLENDKDFSGNEVEREVLPILCARASGKKGNGPKVLFSTHVDIAPIGDNSAWTVEPFKGEQQNDIIYGRGASTSKSGLVAALEVFQVLTAERDFAGELILLVLPGGEDSNAGALAAIRRGVKPDYCIIARPSFSLSTSSEGAAKKQAEIQEEAPQMNGSHGHSKVQLDQLPSLVIGQAGYTSFKIHIKGKKANGGFREEGENALTHYLPIHLGLLKLEKEMNEKESHPLMKSVGVPYPLNVGSIHGGDWSNSVMDHLVVEGRIGIPLGESVELVKEKIQKVVDEASKKDDWLSVHPPKVDFSGYKYNSFILPDWETSILMESLSKSIQSHFHVKPTPSISTQGTDLQLWRTQVGSKVCVFGPGDVRKAHAADESVSLTQIEKVVQVYLETVSDLFKPGKVIQGKLKSSASSLNTSTSGTPDKPDKSGWWGSLFYDIMTV